MLDNNNSGKKGTVVFDDDVVVPALYDKKMNERGENHPWMSLTPFEILTLRSGTRRAKGTTIVAGLGLGHQLIEVSLRKKVRDIILIEREQELVDWLLPEIKKFCADKPIKVVVDDFWTALPRLKGDVVLIDIFGSYGFNGPSHDYRLARLLDECKEQIPAYWVWGSGHSGKNSLWD